MPTEPPDEDSRPPASIAESLELTLRSLRGPSRAAVGGVFGRWDEIVGAPIATHVRPTRLDGEVLTVRVDEPAWATHVQFLTADLIERIRTETGTVVTEVRVRVGK